MTDPKPSAEDVSNASAISDASAKRPFNPDGGEDEGGAPDGGDDSRIHDDQKPITGNAAGSTSGDGNDDRHKPKN